jgi:hypothetical protein
MRSRDVEHRLPVSGTPSFSIPEASKGRQALAVACHHGIYSHPADAYQLSKLLQLGAALLGAHHTLADRHGHTVAEGEALRLQEFRCLFARPPQLPRCGIRQLVDQGWGDATSKQSVGARGARWQVARGRVQPCRLATTLLLPKMPGSDAHSQRFGVTHTNQVCQGDVHGAS